MNSLSSIVTVLSEASEVELQFNGLGFFSVPIEEGMILHVLERPSLDTPLLIVEIGTVSDGQRDIVASLVEEISQNGLADDLVLELDPETSLLTAKCEVPREAEDPVVYETALSRLLHYAERWRVELPMLGIDSEPEAFGSFSPSYPSNCLF